MVREGGGGEGELERRGWSPTNVSDNRYTSLIGGIYDISG